MTFDVEFKEDEMTFEADMSIGYIATEEMIENAYNSGYNKMLDTYWEHIQKNGTRINYSNLYKGCDVKGFEFYPKYPMTEVTHIDYIGGEANGLVKVGELILTKCTVSNYAFYRCFDLEQIDGFILPISNSWSNTFTYAGKLKRIGRIDMSGHTKGGYVFYGCSSLEEINFEGTINCSISFQWCTKLTHDSLMSIINALKDYSEDTSGTTYTLTLGATNVAKLTEVELDIAYSKGWLIA